MNSIDTYKEKTFEDIKHIDELGNEYWEARELMLALEYSKQEHFAKVINKAKIRWENSIIQNEGLTIIDIQDGKNQKQKEKQNNKDNQKQKSSKKQWSA